ncbi:UPF0481 protein [Camellia lanceoleosa]|uniref:UPF0481 protein n=1 Tax=Camellia lanceoleosa TaxID=1840588 RepID=A0ACC0GTM4_9ERIC|nr:UPF0481 protein [Camellia lanceoleosa]
MERNGGADFVAVSIREKLAKLSVLQSECCIYRVRKQLRELNEKAYEPEIVAIGPYHRDKPSLKMMEEHKLRYFQFILQQNNNATVERFIIAVRSLEQEARRCYAEPITLSPDEMIEMMILDGCFIIKLLHKFETPCLRANDPIFDMDWIVNSLQRDLLLFENQLPFSILCKLFDIIEDPDNHNRLIHLVTRFFNDLLPDRVCSNIGNSSCRHLLGVIHNNWLPFEPNDSKKEESWCFIPSATELQEAGVKLKKDKRGKLFDIKFKSGVMQIPPITIEDRTETFFRNLIAYEEYCPDNELSYVIDYVKFMDCLIKSPKDVEILCRYGIIDNWQGDYGVVARLFNKISAAVTGPGKHFRYADVFNKVNNHRRKRRNRWMAILNRNYLNSPWALISILAALVLLLLTLTQTVFTVFPIKL